LSTLKYVQRSGRIGKVASVAGDLFNIKPLVYLKNGEIKFFGRARGMNQGYKMMIEELKKDTEGKDMLRVAISHSNVEDEALKLKSMIEEVYPDLSIDISPLTLAIGLHVGPGVVSIGYTYK
ncbi:DegV family protein, partial [Vibrio parahaemolyticus]|nr:DegV family protein [Vibrio parahaemolyticus]